MRNDRRAKWVSVFVLVLGFVVLLTEVSILLKQYGLVDEARKVAEWRSQVPQIASNHMQVNGVLAGVTITLIVLFSALRLQGSPQGGSPPILEELSMSLFTIAFFGYVASGVLFSVTPERGNNHQFSLFAVASSLYYLSAVLSFIALVPLVRLMGYKYLQPVIMVLVGGAVLGGYLAVAIPFSDLLLIRGEFLVLGGVCSVLVAATVYRASATGMGSRKIEALISKVLLVYGLLVSIVFSICMFSFFYEWLLHLGVSLGVLIAVTTACLYVATATLSVVKHHEYNN